MRFLRLLLVCSAVVGSAHAQADLPPGPVRVSGGVMAAQIMSTVPPTYPPIAKAAHVTGAVVMHAIIGKDGFVENLSTVSGPEMLRAAAADAVRQWRWKPFLLNGEPVAVDTVVTVNFNLTEPAPAPADAPEVRTPASAAELAPVQNPPRIAGGIMAGHILTHVAPHYPAEAKAKGISGTVVMHAVIGKQGNIANLFVISGPEELRASALEAVSQWTYQPYLLNGEPTEVDTTITVNYKLGSPPPAAPPSQ